MGAGKPYGDESSKETLSIRFTRPGRYSPALSSSSSCACDSRGRDNRAFTGKGTSRERGNVALQVIFPGRTSGPREEFDTGSNFVQEAPTGQCASAGASSCRG